MQVAVTIYYPSDVGRFRKTANAFGIAKNTMSMIIRRATKVISNHLTDKCIKWRKSLNPVISFLKNMVSHSVLGL